MLGVGLVLTFAVSMWFAVMIDAGLSALTITIVLLLARVRCLRCNEIIDAPDLTQRERRSLHLQQGLSVVLAAAMLMLSMWAKGNWDTERGVGRPRVSSDSDTDTDTDTEEAADDSQQSDEDMPPSTEE